MQLQTQNQSLVGLSKQNLAHGAESYIQNVFRLWRDKTRKDVERHGILPSTILSILALIISYFFAPPIVTAILPFLVFLVTLFIVNIGWAWRQLYADQYHDIDTLLNVYSNNFPKAVELAELIGQGKWLKGSYTVPPVNEVEGWVKEVELFLETKLDRSHLDEFKRDVEPIVPNDIDNFRNEIGKRLMTLRRFMAELKQPPPLISRKSELMSHASSR